MSSIIDPFIVSLDEEPIRTGTADTPFCTDARCRARCLDAIWLAPDRQIRALN